MLSKIICYMRFEVIKFECGNLNVGTQKFEFEIYLLLTVEFQRIFIGM